MSCFSRETSVGSAAAGKFGVDLDHAAAADGAVDLLKGHVAFKDAGVVLSGRIGVGQIEQSAEFVEKQLGIGTLTGTGRLPGGDKRLNRIRFLL